MKKPNNLREYLVSHLKFLQDNPDKLSMHIESGRYRSTLANGYGMESISPVKFIIQDFTGDPDLIAFLLFQWLRVNQSELLANLDKNKNAVKFEAEFLDNDKADVMFEFELTERVIIQRQDNGSYNFSYPDEPQYSPGLPVTECEMADEQGNILATWTSIEPSNTVALEMPLAKKPQ